MIRIYAGPVDLWANVLLRAKPRWPETHAVNNAHHAFDPRLMRRQISLGMAVAIVTTILFWASAGFANSNPDSLLKCGSFTLGVLPAPVPQNDSEAVERFEAIAREIKSSPDVVLFLGDSLTQKWDPTAWQRYFAPLGALNAGVNGDRTEHLLWRLEHGTLDGQKPRVVVVLIGTNDIGRDRAAELVAEGIRANLKLLRVKLPAARILLLGVLPRGETPSFRRRQQVRGVNTLIQRCADGEHIHYADLGDLLLDPRGILSRAISPDGVHLSQQGYSLLAEWLQRNLKKILELQ